MKIKADNKDDLRKGLDQGMTFSHQFESFLAIVEIDPYEEKQIRNELGLVPSEWMVVDSRNVKKGSLVRGVTTWTNDYVYVKNTSPRAGKFSIRFFRGEPKSRGLDKSDSTEMAKYPRVILDATGGLTIPNSTTGKQTVAINTETLDEAGICTLSSNKFKLDILGDWDIVCEMDSLSGSTFSTITLRNDTQSSDVGNFQNMTAGSSPDSSNPTRRYFFEVTDVDDEYILQWVTGDASTTMSVSSMRIFLEPRWI